jgi:hypothetical protein
LQRALRADRRPHQRSVLRRRRARWRFRLLRRSGFRQRQAYIGADYYWKGKHPGWAYFTAVPFGLTYTEMDAWIKFGGGQELWDELAGEFGLKNFAMRQHRRSDGRLVQQGNRDSLTT